MANNQHLSLVVLLTIFVAGAHAYSTLSHDNPIKQFVPECLHYYEASVVQVIGNTHHARQFARFAHMYGKIYRTAEEMKQRFSIFSESLKMIGSHYKKNLTYTLGVNRFVDIVRKWKV
ncbi:hypothetical protein POM88_040732 [Heracleum sosnowskyi]|uniref:Cathepsin propeptide inhibitor domain-containing protein n=1 Tax=Heracleum sosnowskyi TaxID=360622 RepID=A0AAD8HEM6_9APIA|nr:hypothetical protein POM88_040732 [Heracleum sosnowskyi]